jgi:hypothetical protein
MGTHGLFAHPSNVNRKRSRRELPDSSSIIALQNRIEIPTNRRT